MTIQTHYILEVFYRSQDGSMGPDIMQVLGIPTYLWGGDKAEPPTDIDGIGEGPYNSLAYQRPTEAECNDLLSLISGRMIENTATFIFATEFDDAPDEEN